MGIRHVFVLSHECPRRYDVEDDGFELSVEVLRYLKNVVSLYRLYRMGERMGERTQ